MNFTSNNNLSLASAYSIKTSYSIPVWHDYYVDDTNRPFAVLNDGDVFLLISFKHIRNNWYTCKILCKDICGAIFVDFDNIAFVKEYEYQGMPKG